MDLEIPSGDVRLAAYIANPPVADSAPPTLVLCHGYPSSALGAADTNRSYPELADRVANEGWRVLTFAFRGCGGSTGDFSLGVQGYRIRGGKIAEPVAEMNISGNHLEFWKKIGAVGNDPFPYSPMNAPTLVFEGVSFAGV